MIKAGLLNLSLSTTTALGAVGGAVYYSKKSFVTNQPVTHMGGVGNEYKSSGDSNMVTDLTNLLNIDLTSVADLTKNISKLGGLEKMGGLAGNLSNLTDIEDDSGGLGEDEDEDDIQGETDTSEEVDDDEEGDSEPGKNVTAEDKTEKKSTEEVINQEERAEKNEQVNVETVTEIGSQEGETKPTETTPKEKEEETDDTNKDEPKQNTQEDEEKPVVEEPEDKSKSGETLNKEGIAEDLEKVEVPAQTENVPNTPETGGDEGQEEIGSVKPLTDEEKDVQNANGLKKLAEAGKEEESTQHLRDEKARQQAEKPSQGIELQDTETHGSTINLSDTEDESHNVSGDGESVDPTQPAPTTQTEDPTDLGGGEVETDNSKLGESTPADGEITPQNASNEDSAITTPNPTETTQIQEPSGTGDQAESNPPNIQGDSDSTPINGAKKEEPSVVEGRGALDDETPGDGEGLTGAGTEQINKESPVTETVKPDVTGVPDMKNAITKGPGDDGDSTHNGGGSEGETRQLAGVGGPKSKDGSKGVGPTGSTDSGAVENKNTEDEFEEEIEEEENEEGDAQEVTPTSEDQAEADSHDEEISDTGIENNSSGDIITLIASLGTSIGNN